MISSTTTSTSTSAGLERKERARLAVLAKAWRLRWAGVVLATACIGISCSKRADPVPVGDAAASSVEAPVRPRVDSRVLIEVGDASFWEGTVTGSSPEAFQVRVGTTIHSVTADRVHEVEKAGAMPGPGDFAACRIGPQSWVACRVGADSGSRLAATDEWGAERGVEAAGVVTLDAASQARARTRLERMAHARAFDLKAARARMPSRPPGWRPKPGQVVVARYGDTLWREARVLGVTPVAVNLEWMQRGTRATRPGEQIAPAVGARRAPRPGDLVLARTPSGGAWEVMRANVVDERGTEVEDRETQRRVVGMADLIALEP